MDQRKRMSAMDMVVFVVVVGLAFGVIVGIRVGDGNQEETVPLIVKAMDDSTFAGDMFIERMAETFGPRHYFTATFAALGRVMPVPVAIALMTVLATLGTAAASFYVAYRLFARNALAAMLACLMVMTVDGINIGGLCTLRNSSLVPQTLVMGGVMLAFWWALSGRALFAAAMFAAMGFWHPSVAVQGGMIALAAGALAHMTAEGVNRSRRWRIGGTYLAAMAVLGAYAVVVWIIPAGGVKLTGDALDTFINVRIPHHALPGTFPATDWLQLAGLLAAMAMAWRVWARSDSYDRQIGRGVAALVAVTVAVLAAGYVFVQWLPIRIVVISLVWRMAFILNWLGLTLLGGVAALLLQQNRLVTRGGAAAIGLGCGLWHPLTAALGAAGGAVAGEGRKKLATAVAAALVAAGLVVVVLTHTYEIRYKIFIALVMVAMLSIRRPALRRAAPVMLLVVLATLQVAMHYDSVPMVWRLRGTLLARVIVDPWDAGKPIDGISRIVDDRLPADAVLLVPPREGGRIRTLTHRAVVWDFKILGYDNDCLAQWRERMEVCYGKSPLTSYDLWDYVDGAYRDVTGAQLAAARDRYGADYAILYVETPCALTEVAQDGDYKLISLRN